jgi:carboxyl-terminal processing protease
MRRSRAPAGPLLGFAAGLGTALAAAILAWPRPSPDLERYRAVRDWVRSAALEPADPQTMSDDALRGLAAGLDEHSAWYSQDELRALDRDTGGRYLGLGISLRPPASDGRILFPLRGSPAEAAGILPGDRIVRVDGQGWAELGHEGFRSILASPTPRRMELDLAGLDGSERQVQVSTASIVEPSVRHEALVDAELGVGYVALRSFSQESPGELDAALERLSAAGLAALVLDLRGNQGGVLSSAVEIAARFVPEGVLVRTRGRNHAGGQRIEEQRAAGGARWSGLPLVVLVDAESASAAEVLAGALQDHRAAVLVGEATFGKGLVQSIHRLDDGSGAIKVTTSRYETPAGRRLERRGAQARGLQPDVEVRIGAESRRALAAHLARPSPPARWRAALDEWQRREGIELFAAAPQDPALEVALELFRGHRPGPHRPDGDA